MSKIALIFGGPDMIPSRVEAGLKLYEVKKADKLILTGGIGFLNFDRKTPEAIKMQEFLLKKGVKKSDILLEPNSRSTKENIDFSLKLLEAKGYNLEETELVLISSELHIDRCLKLLKEKIAEENRELKNISIVSVKIKNPFLRATLYIKEAIMNLV